MKYYHIITFGCQMNKNDSEHLAGMLEFNGYKEIDDPFRANLVVLNTCAVRDKAERRVYGQLAKLNSVRKKNKLDMKLYLCGCMPAYKKDSLKKELPYLDGFMDVAEARHYPAKRKGDGQAWVMIMYGCDNFCSYCIVPYVRGREISRPAEDVIEEIKKLNFKNIDYVCLLGQNVNSYQGTLGGKKIDFPTLLEKIILAVPEIQKIGFMTSHPKDMSDKLIEIIAKYPKVDREIHLPIQHFNDRILKLMNRKYTAKDYLILVKKLRDKVPSIKISTDLIVGFPSETEKEFKEVLAGVKKTRFYRIISSAYSIRSGTKAGEMKEQIPEKTKNARLNKLNEYIKKYAGLHRKNS